MDLPGLEPGTFGVGLMSAMVSDGMVAEDVVACAKICTAT